MDNNWLSQYLQNTIVPDIYNSSKIQNKEEFLSHWIKRLRDSRRLTAHEKGNLQAIVAGASFLLGKQYQPALDFLKRC